MRAPSEKRGASENMKMLETRMPPRKKTRKDCALAKTLAYRRSSTESMDQNIWKEFPEDLFEVVIARLPVVAFFRLRLVCQKWNMLLSSKSFSQEYAQKKQAQAWFYTISHTNGNKGSMYDPSSKKWYHPAPLKLPTALRFFPVASAGGLICLLDIDARNIYVCNPLTLSCRQLPSMSFGVFSHVSVGMTLINGESGYKILCFGYGGEYVVYDSTDNSWSRPRSIPSAYLPLSLNGRSQAVCINTTLYFMRHNPNGVLCYDMETGVWKQFSIPTPQHLVDQTLTDCGGRIMLVGLLQKNAAACVCIWELQKMTWLWKEVDRMPNVWCLEFYGKHVRMFCLGNRGLLMVSLRSRQMNWMVSYDAWSREWVKVKVPCCTQRRTKRRRLLDCGTAFHPCLTSIP